MEKTRTLGVLLGCLVLVGSAGAASAGWQAGLKAAVDSNVTRELGGGKTDEYVLGSASYSGGGTGEERLDWLYTVAAEGAAYASVTKLNYGAVALSPGLLYHFSPSWTVSLAPFLRFKASNDSDQSATAFGLTASLRQQLTDVFYAEERYTYTDNRARADVFSYTEHALGALLGARWTERLWTELGYGFSRGDSFRTVDASTSSTATGSAGSSGSTGSGGMSGSSGSGMGAARTAARMMNSLDNSSGKGLIKEPVRTHTVTATLGLNLGSGFTPFAGYTYEAATGASGTAHSNIGFLGLNYEF